MLLWTIFVFPSRSSPASPVHDQFPHPIKVTCRVFHAITHDSESNLIRLSVKGDLHL